MARNRIWLQRARVRLMNRLIAIKLGVDLKDLPPEMIIHGSQPAAIKDLKWKLAMGSHLIPVSVKMMRLSDRTEARIETVGDGVPDSDPSMVNVENWFWDCADAVCEEFRRFIANVRPGVTDSSSALPSIVGPVAALPAQPDTNNTGKQPTNSKPVDNDIPSSSSSSNNLHHKQKASSKHTMEKKATSTPEEHPDDFIKGVVEEVFSKPPDPNYKPLDHLPKREEKARPIPEQREAHWNKYMDRYDEGFSKEPGDLYKSMMEAMGETSGRTANKKKSKKRLKSGEDIIAPNGCKIKQPMDTADLSALIHELMADVSITSLASPELLSEAAEVSADLDKTVQKEKAAAGEARRQQDASSSSSSDDSEVEPEILKLADVLINAARGAHTKGKSTSSQPAKQSSSSAVNDSELTRRLAALSTDGTLADAPVITFTPASPTSSPDYTSPQLGVANMQTITKVGEGETIAIGESALEATSTNGKATKAKGKKGKKGKKSKKNKGKGKAPQEAETTAAGPSTSGSSGAHYKAPDENGFEELVAGDMTDPHKDITDLDELIRIAREHIEPF